MSTNVGKILVVDNEYDSKIEKAISALVRDGISVQYWNGKNGLPETIRNVRVVVLDLDLAGAGFRSPGLTHYGLAVQALNKIPGPYLVIIMAQDFIKDDPSNLSQAYIETYDKPICGLVASTGLVKDDEVQNPSLLKQLIIESISNDDILKMAFLWEDVINKATDLALNDLIPKEVEPTMVTIIKTFCKELGDDAASRELIDLLMQLVSRRIAVGKSFEDFKNLVTILNKKSRTAPTAGEKAEIYNRIMFYIPILEEKPWTGDIYKSISKNKFGDSDYAIVLNSPCDLAQNKTWSFRVSIGFVIKPENFEDLEYPPYKIDSTLTERRKKNPNEKIDTYKKFAKEHYSNNSKFCESLYMLHNLKEEESFIKLCFDFNNVKSLEEPLLLKEWNRIGRLDSPFLEELLQKYSNHAFRIGTMPINKPT
jgi:hypothetical protein